MEDKYKLSYADETMIYHVFSVKKWPIDTTNDNSLFQRYRKRCEILNREERELFYKLTLEYRWILLDEYVELLIKLLIKTVDDFFKPAQQIYVYPIKTVHDHDLIKSADVLSYLCKTTQIRHVDKLNKKVFRIVTTLQELKKKKCSTERSFIIIDDYIGSGRYAKSVANELIENGIPKDNIIICSLFISENGKKALKESGYKVEFVETVDSALNKLSPKEQKLLKCIEEKIHVSSEYSFGYNGSANLISLIRTPNNTLPVFWYKNSSRTSTPPFERRN